MSRETEEEKKEDEDVLFIQFTTCIGYVLLLTHLGVASVRYSALGAPTIPPMGQHLPHLRDRPG